MSYEKQNFSDGQTLTASHLNHIEDGIANLDERVDNSSSGCNAYLHTVYISKLDYSNGEDDTPDGIFYLDIFIKIITNTNDAITFEKLVEIASNGIANARVISISGVLEVNSSQFFVRDYIAIDDTLSIQYATDIDAIQWTKIIGIVASDVTDSVVKLDSDLLTEV